MVLWAWLKPMLVGVSITQQLMEGCLGVKGRIQGSAYPQREEDWTTCVASQPTPSFSREKGGGGNFQVNSKVRREGLVTILKGSGCRVGGVSVPDSTTPAESLGNKNQRGRGS